MWTTQLPYQVCLALVCAAMLAACAGIPTGTAEGQPTLQATDNVGAVASPSPVPSLTAPSPQPTTQIATVVTATETLAATAVVTSPATLPQSLLDKLPKDESGRVIGGPHVPCLNYSPTMITGKPCPRVTKWTWKVINLAPPLRPYGQVDDRCVVQNAVDDFVRTEFADPSVNTPESMKQIEPLYASDLAILDGLMPVIREGYLKFYHEGKTPYYVCDKPRFKLLDVNPRSPSIADNSGKVSGNAIQLTVLGLTLDR